MAETKTKAKQYEFKAEIRKLLDILVNSLYTNQEIFLRELVSNASDALDKARFAQSRGDAVADPDQALEIRIGTDPDQGTLTVRDFGVGMNADEAVENLGTIAHSGTARFVEAMAEGREAKGQDPAESMDNIIGQFGVGFYSVYMVADRVEVTSRAADPGAESVVWSSDGQGAFEVAPGPGDFTRGTEVKVHLKKESAEFTQKNLIQEVIKRHSNFISFPIFVDDERVNTVAALWREPRSQVSAEQYAEFYKFLTLDNEDPLETIHLSADAPVQYSSLLFVPGKNLDFLGLDQGPKGVDLYVNRVLIQSGNTDVLPEYLGFLRGVVDSEDLPLNISRESLQANAPMRKIKSAITKSVLSRLGEMAEKSPGDYERFWKEHARVFKMGYADFANKEAFADLVRFNSTHHDSADGLTSLAAYVERAGEEQKEIYYISGASREAALASPHLDLFGKQGVEVLLLTEPVDEFVMESLGAYKEHKLVSAENADTESVRKLGAEAGEEHQELTEEEKSSLDGLLARMKEILGESVTEVRASTRLADSPVCLASPDGQMTSGMQKIMQIITKDTSIPQKVLEVNPTHPLTRNLVAVYERDPGDEYISLAARQLLESALLQEGYLADPHALVRHIQEHLTSSSRMYAEKRD
jgi:molecular chaperone HtpG